MPTEGITLGQVESREPRPQGGDDLGELTGLHALTRRLAQTQDLQQRAKLLCGLCATYLAASAARWCAVDRYFMAIAHHGSQAD